MQERVREHKHLLHALRWHRAAVATARAQRHSTTNAARCAQKAATVAAEVTAAAAAATVTSGVGIPCGGGSSEAEQSSTLTPFDVEQIRQALQQIASSSPIWLRGVQLVARCGAVLAASVRSWSTVSNLGNGSCFIHSLAHRLGMLALADSSLPEQLDRSLRLYLCDWAIWFITNGRYHTVAAFRDADPAERQFSPDGLQLALKRAAALDISDDWRRSTAATSDITLILLNRVVEHAEPKRWIPASWGLLVSLWLRKAVFVWQPEVASRSRRSGPSYNTGCTGYKLMQFLGSPVFAFVPEGLTADDALQASDCYHVLYHWSGDKSRPLDGHGRGNHFELLRDPKGTAAPVTPVPMHPECEWMRQRELQQLQLREQQQQEHDQQQGSVQPSKRFQKQKVTCCHCSVAFELALQKPWVTLTKHARECRKMGRATNKYEMLCSMLNKACAQVVGTTAEQQLAALRACKKCSGIVNSSCTHNCKSGSSVVTTRGTGSTPDDIDPTGSGTPFETPPSESSKQRDVHAPADGDLRWSVNDAQIADALDDISVDTLIRTRFSTSARCLRSVTQCRQLRETLTHTLRQLNVLIDEARAAQRGTVGGVGAAAANATATSLVRAMKLLMLIFPAAVGKQKRGRAVAAKLRMHSLHAGTFAGLLSQTVAAASQCASSSSSECKLADPDGVFEVSDIKAQDVCAKICTKRGGLGQCARRLEAREARAPKDQTTLDVLVAKHQAAGASLTVTTKDTNTVRSTVAAALRRWGLAPTATDTSSSGTDDDNNDQRELDPLLVTSEDVMKALSKASAGKAAGLDGLRYEHLWSCLAPNAATTVGSGTAFEVNEATPAFIHEIAKLFTALLNEPTLLPDEAWRLLRAAAVSGVGEKRRPIAVTSVWRRLLASIANATVSKRIAAALEALHQYGVGIPTGVEHVAQRARQWHDLGGTLLQLDCKNAFNSVCRTAIISGLERFCPELLPLFAAVYCGDITPELRAELLVQAADGTTTIEPHIIQSELGCQQGDPLGPLLFAVAVTHALNPIQPDEQLIVAHAAYLDDLNLCLRGPFDDAAVERVQLLLQRLRDIGLEVNTDKSRATAKRGCVFSAEERRRWARLGIPYTDTDTPEIERGFVTVGVPVGSDEFIQQHLRGKLFDVAQWRLAWHLSGMAARHFHQAQRVLSGCLGKRFIYLARNVSPRLSAPWMAGFDTLCTWTLERMLSLDGAVSAAELQKFLEEYCSAGDAAAVHRESPLQLKELGHAAFPALPLQLSKLARDSGGLGMPDLSTTCSAAYIAQLQATLAPSYSWLKGLLDLQGMDPIGGLAASDFMSSYATGLRHWSARSDLSAYTSEPHPVLAWATATTAAEETDTAAQEAIMAAAVDPATFAVKEISAPTNPTSAEDSATADAEGALPSGLQRKLTSLVHKCTSKRLYAKLGEQKRAVGHSKVATAGELILARLLSQSGQFAMAWLDPSGSTLETPNMTLMMLMALAVDPYRLSGQGCPYKHCNYKHATCEHAVGCVRQNLRCLTTGHNNLKRFLQDLCLSNGVRMVGNEDTSVLKNGLRADTTIYRGGLQLCSIREWQTLGFVLDTTIRTPTTDSYLRVLCSNSANTAGFAAEAGDDAKIQHHQDQLVEGYKLVPMVQESYGRMGRQAASFVKQLAAHSATCKGGSTSQILRRRAVIHASIRTQLSTALAREVSERVFAYIRGARRFHGRKVHSVSALLL